MNKEIPAFAGMAVLFVFADNTEFGGIRKCKIRHSGESRNLIRRPANSRLSPPSHSCEGRNFHRREAAGNCTAFGDSLRLSARRFLPSQEWDGWDGKRRRERRKLRGDRV
ncbi:MAG: hypothetical protein ACR2QC_05610 [Gammaproteobacteria bacterium]